ncbi:MAG TPA: class I SAM-dependent methyltransferase [Xanthomonadales bacterium]|nr:class I SAM-dependent methyltransferase [Xanthomonadales bacterium]
MDNNAAETSHWSGMSARYAAYTPPLRISPSERNSYFELASQWQTEQQRSGKHPGAPPRVLVLGATPDFYYLPWPAGTDLLAVDHSADMLAAIWPGSSKQRLCADWSTMNLPDASRDVMLCDGGYTFISSPEPLRRMAENVARILAPGGRFVVRLFVNAEQQETPAELFRALELGSILTISELKLRLWLALNGRQKGTANVAGGKGVRLVDVWRCFQAEYKSPELLDERVSWSDDSLWQSMQAYEDKIDTYYFPSVDEVSQAFLQTTFKLEKVALVEPQVHCGQHLRLLSLKRPG